MNASWQTVLRACLGKVAAPKVETVARAQGLGRLLACAVMADRDYPAGNLSMMDGYAIDQALENYQVEGENRPGSGSGQPLAYGTARRIFTGAELPQGSIRVVPQELTQREGDSLRITEYPDTPFVRAGGSEARRGGPVLPPGLRLGPVELSILAALGTEQIEVTVRPRIAHLVTGDEVMAPGEKGEPGPRIRDSNSDLVSAVLGGIGQTVGDHRRIHDDREVACRIVQEMASICEVLLISGGASVGDHDHARVALESAGFHFEAHGLDVRPGKPVGLARRDKQWAIALPGNPVSHLVALQLFVIPLLLALEGQAAAEPSPQRGVLEADFSAPVPRRDTFWPSSVQLSEGVWRLTPCRFLTSGDLLGIVGATALLVLPAGKPVPRKGDEIFFLSLAPVFSNACPP
jgi:molybdopterin molybdotransferase